MKIIDIDPRNLVYSDRNLRREVGDIFDLLSSIPEVGVLAPLIVVATDDPDRYEISAGHRRQAAAAELGLATVPCIVADSMQTADQIAIMLAENLHRKGLSTTEEACGYAQLALLDWEPERIAKVAGRSVAHVKNAIALRGLPDAAQQAADNGQLDLSHVAALQEFTDEPEVMQRILDKGSKGHWGFQHAIAEARTTRDRTRAAETLRRDLIKSGVKVTGKPKGWPYNCPQTRAADLSDADGIRLEPDEAMTAPGFRVFIDSQYGPPTAVVYCTDPEEFGYTRTAYSSYTSEHDQLLAEERDTAQAARREALAIAAPVRRDFCIQRYSSAKAVKPLYVDVLRDAAADPDSLRLYRTEFADAVAGVAVNEHHGEAGIDRLSRILVARWLAVGEVRLDHAATSSKGTGGHCQALKYLDRLVADGYELCDAEQELHAALTTDLAADDEEAVDGAGEDDDADPVSVPNERPSADDASAELASDEVVEVAA